MNFQFIYFVVGMYKELLIANSLGNLQISLDIDSFRKSYEITFRC